MNELFIDGITINNQRMSSVFISPRMGEKLDFNFDEDSGFNWIIDLEIYTKKEDEKAVLILIDFKYGEENVEIPLIDIRIEGLYEIDDSTTNEEAKSLIENYCPYLTFGFLRTTVFQITTLTNGQGVYLPLISMDEIHKNRNIKIDKKQAQRKKQQKSSNPKKKVRKPRTAKKAKTPARKTTTKVAPKKK